jgi:sterol desaturase/sphingolipid hydroxylase (fatty acid hydroxylase superfamily)
VLEGPTILYPFVFYALVACVAAAEMVVPARRATVPIDRRWITNIGLFLIGLATNRLLAAVSAVAFADMVTRAGLGLLPLLDISAWPAVILGVLVLDLWKYVEHRVMHAVPILWRLHLLHHADVDIDFTSTERHHPFETMFGLATTWAAIALLGLPPLAVLLFLFFAMVTTLFGHANLRLPRRLDRWLQWVVITPAYHTVHHGTPRAETDSNFANILTLWDRLFASYRASTPERDAERILGLAYFRDPRSARLDRALCLPFLAIPDERPPVAANADRVSLAP